MPPRRSAGILVHRTGPDGVEVLLGHMGGPFWAARQLAAWSIPKGEPEGAEDLRDAARREFTEELGLAVPDGDLLDLGSARQSGGKTVSIWAVAGDVDVESVRPGTFELEWPPRSGRFATFPEIDEAAWWAVEPARERLVAGQRVFLDRLVEALARLSGGRLGAGQDGPAGQEGDRGDEADHQP